MPCGTSHFRGVACVFWDFVACGLRLLYVMQLLPMLVLTQSGWLGKLSLCALGTWGGVGHLTYGCVCLRHTSDAQGLCMSATIHVWCCHATARASIGKTESSKRTNPSTFVALILRLSSLCGYAAGVRHPCLHIPACGHCMPPSLLLSVTCVAHTPLVSMQFMDCHPPGSTESAGVCATRRFHQACRA